MGHVTKETLENTWKCFREIEAGEKLLNDLAEMKEKTILPHEQRLRDAFGRGRDLQLGVPSGDIGHRLFDVSPTLAIAIIKSHIANKKAELDEMHEIIRCELDREAEQTP